jgi:hypothetical protein
MAPPADTTPRPNIARWPLVLRALAVLIAVAAVIDPQVTTLRRHRPLLSVVAGDGDRDRALASDVERALRGRYSLVRAPLSTASGTVLVGDRLPEGAREMASPVVAVSPRTRGPRVRITQVRAPTRASLESRATIDVTMSLEGFSAGDAPVSADIDLARVVDGNTLVVARERRTARRDTTVTVSLDVVPTAAEPTVLRVTAGIAGRADTSRTDVVIDVRTDRWSVLFFDRRPSWMSTFVRRSIERDPRFAVTSRIITSTNVSRETGRAPSGLDAVAATETFDVVVIGAPDALTARDVDGMRTLLRERGASVMVLADRAAPGPADALLGFGGWRTTPRRTPVDLAVSPIDGTAISALTLRGLSIGLPARLPSGAIPMAVVRDDRTGAATGVNADEAARARTVVWRMPVGLGDLVVSGAFDAWRYRDTAQSTFDATWRDLVEQSASRRQAVFDVALSQRLVEPGTRINLTVDPRDTTNESDMRVVLRARDSTSTVPSTDIALHGGQRSARHSATFRAPATPGAFDLLVFRGLDTARTALVVAERVARDAQHDPALLDAWARSRSGKSLARDEVATLPSVMDELVLARARAATWHPMRSPWWILPFAVLLAAEWWMRRRRGLA